MPQPERPANARIEDSSPGTLGLLYFPYLRGLAHELNNPLTGILGYSQLLALGVAGQDGAAEELREIESCAVRCRDLVALLSRCSRAEEAPIPYDPVQVFEDLVALMEPLAHRRNVQLVVRRAEGLMSLKGRPWRVRASLLGLAGLSLGDPTGVEASRVMLGLRSSGPEARVEIGFPNRSAGWLREALTGGMEPDPAALSAPGAACRALEALGQGVEIEERTDGAFVVVSLR